LPYVKSIGIQCLGQKRKYKIDTLFTINTSFNGKCNNLTQIKWQWFAVYYGYFSM